VPVLTIDLGDPRVREAARAAAPGRFVPDSWTALSGETVSLVDAPLRLLVLIPLDASLASESEAIAAAILGSDPVPRAIGALLPVAGSSEGVTSRAIPEWFAMGDAMRFIELRSEEASVANPRTGISSITTGASSGWTDEFRKDVLGHLTDPELFDAAWHAIPRNRPSAVGLRIVSLGEGRSRAVADLALRLAEELDPNREPETGVELPERWDLDKRLYPITPPYPTDPAYIAALPAPIRGLAAVKRGNPIAIASRTASQYEEAVALGLGMLKSEPPRLRALIDAAERTEPDGPYLEPVGAAALEAEFPGAVFGDSLAREYAEKADGAERVGELLNQAADSQADGLSAALLAHWFSSDADAVRPAGPRTLSPRLEEKSQQWSQLAQAIDEVEPASAPSRSWLPWLLSFATGGPEMVVREEPNPSTEQESSPSNDEAPDQSEVQETASGEEANKSVELNGDETSADEGGTPEAAANGKPNEGAAESRQEWRIPPRAGEEPWRVPKGLGFVLGSYVWRRRFRAYIFSAITVGLLIAVFAQVASDISGIRIIDLTMLGLDEADTLLLINVIRWIAINAIGYFLVSMLVSLAISQWAEAFRFHEIPDALALLRADARALAQSEAGRITARRDYARLSVEAAGTLIEGTTLGAETSRAFAEQVPIDHAERSPVSKGAPPHRRHVGDEVVSGTDAAGIYRVYRLYVIALRQLFALSLVSAVKERWPRIRGTYWKETRALVAQQASAGLKKRLQTVLDRGLLKGDLLRNGIDPAEQVAARIWSDPVVREAALSAMNLDDSDAMPILATPAENRLLDLHEASSLVVSIPSTLEELLVAEGSMPSGTIVASRSLEEVAVFRFYPYQESIYRIEGGPTGETGLVS
jgi:hypothetical protein